MAFEWLNGLFGPGNFAGVGNNAPRSAGLFGGQQQTPSGQQQFPNGGWTQNVGQPGTGGSMPNANPTALSNSLPAAPNPAAQNSGIDKLQSFLNSPQGLMGLLGMGGAMLQASGPSTVPQGLGQIFGAGIGSMPGRNTAGTGLVGGLMAGRDIAYQNQAADQANQANAVAANMGDYIGANYGNKPQAPVQGAAPAAPTPIPASAAGGFGQRQVQQPIVPGANMQLGNAANPPGYAALLQMLQKGWGR